ncbi:MAG: serine/threonine-protein kinase [Bryobacteraceae bacterium]|nr:serine/threonine-protein kinase [Bryobacteraceae bacterium]
MIGSEIAHYKITGALGEGGMGVVYRAQDTRLKREVALKVLSPVFAQDAERLARFAREAQVLASLNHPGIAAVYGVESNALVMELVEGPTLAERSGPMPWGEALPVVQQLVDAIEYAHEKGIIHRDLKPANIKLTDEGRVKVLDFGLAKALANEPGLTSTNTADSPTMTMALGTVAGVIMGTAAYMAPEQARGKAVDKRADIWAFGVVVYELLTGKRLFEGETVSDILAQTLTKEIDFTLVPMPAQKLLRRCQDRDPRTRLRDIGDARLLLEPEPAATAPPRRRPTLWMAATAAALLIAAATGIQLWRQPRTNPAPVVRLALNSQGPTTISPDGTLFLLQSVDGQSSPLELRRLDELRARPLPGTENARFPFWCADSTAIGFFQNGKLRSINVSTLEIRSHVTAPTPGGADWRGTASSGEVLYVSDGKLHLLDVASSQTRVIPLALAPDPDPLNPVFLPKSQDNFLVLARPAKAPRRALYRTSLKGGETKRLLDTPSRVSLATNPHTGEWRLFFFGWERRNLLMTAVNPSTGEVSGQPEQIQDSVATYGTTFNFSVALTGGVITSRNASTVPVWQVRWHKRNGEITGTIGEKTKRISSLSLSPDGRQVALVIGSFLRDVWIFDRGVSKLRRLSTAPEGVNPLSVWSPDSKWIYYVQRGADDRNEIVRHAASGESAPEVLSRTVLQLMPQAVTLNGKYLLLTTAGDSDPDVFRLDLSRAAAEPEDWLPRSENFRSGGRVYLTPDGKWLLSEGGYFVSLQSQKLEAHRVNLDVQKPFFSPDGKEVCGVRRVPVNRVECQPVTRNAAGLPVLGPSSVLFSARVLGLSGNNVAAMDKDGRILLLSTDQPEELDHQFLSDWTVLLPKEGAKP